MQRHEVHDVAGFVVGAFGNQGLDDFPPELVVAWPHPIRVHGHPLRAGRVRFQSRRVQAVHDSVVRRGRRLKRHL